MTAELNPAKGNRGARVAASACQFSLRACYSNRAKAHGAPASCVDKIKYDCVEKSVIGSGRIAFTFASASAKHQALAGDPIAFAKLCERTAGRQSNCRQMRHIMVALPSLELSDRGRELLGIAICDFVRRLADDQPVWGAIHRPASGEKNYHLHISHGLREIHLLSATEYVLGDRILSEQRPKVRRAHGLAATSHTDLRKLREGIAELIADALRQEKADQNLVERWRCGYLQLDEQVRRAKERCDWQFVSDHEHRDPSQHEGYSGGAQRKRLSKQQTEAGKPPEVMSHRPIGARALTKQIVRYLLALAKRHRIRKFSQLRLLALEHDILIHVVRRKRKDGSRGAVAGLAYQLLGGIRVSGRQINLSLADICTTLGINRSSVSDIEAEPNYEGEYLRAVPVQPDEIRGRFQGRVTDAFVLHILAQKAQMRDLPNIESEAAKTPAPPADEPAVEVDNFNKIAVELSRPLTEAEQHARHALILSELAPDDYLRGYVEHQQSVVMPTNQHGNPVSDFQGEILRSTDESDSEVAISNLAIDDNVQVRQRQSTSI